MLGQKDNLLQNPEATSQKFWLLYEKRKAGIHCNMCKDLWKKKREGDISKEKKYTHMNIIQIVSKMC